MYSRSGILSYGSTTNEGIILNIIQQYGPIDQKMIIQYASTAKLFSQPHASKILSKLEKHGIIESRLSGNGHEKLYSLKNDGRVQQPFTNGKILPPQPKRVIQQEQRSENESWPSYPWQQNCPPPIVVNGKVKFVEDRRVFDPNTQQWIAQGHWETSA